ncbi:hypothetical protein C0995_009361 [Termitomyces sp. Mi166|nr:hypothetical protein C0995_009361 [Termitomyces sp. Mi166\
MDERIEYYQQELLKLQMLHHGNKHQVADGVQVPPPKQLLAAYCPAAVPQSLPTANAKAGSSCQLEPTKNTNEVLPPKDKSKKPIKPTVEEEVEEPLPPIHPFSRIPDIHISESAPKNPTTPEKHQDGTYKMLAPAAMKEQDTDDVLPYPGKSPPGTYTYHSNINTYNASVMEPTGTFGMVDPIKAFYNHWPPEHHASLCITKDMDSLRTIMAVIDGKRRLNV